VPLAGAADKGSSFPFQARRQAGAPAKKPKVRQYLGRGRGAKRRSVYRVLCAVRSPFFLFLLPNRLAPWTAQGVDLFLFSLFFLFLSAIISSFLKPYSILNAMMLFLKKGRRQCAGG